MFHRLVMACISSTWTKKEVLSRLGLFFLVSHCPLCGPDRGQVALCHAGGCLRGSLPRESCCWPAGFLLPARPLVRTPLFPTILLMLPSLGLSRVFYWEISWVKQVVHPALNKVRFRQPTYKHLDKKRVIVARPGTEVMHRCQLRISSIIDVAQTSTPRQSTPVLPKPHYAQPQWRDCAVLCLKTWEVISRSSSWIKQLQEASLKDLGTGSSILQHSLTELLQW